jgi:RNA polymerase sigma-70 factor (ECF subfamily)
MLLCKRSARQPALQRVEPHKTTRLPGGPPAVAQPSSKAALFREPALAEAAAVPTFRPRPTFDEVYQETFHAVWRTARRLGVDRDAIDDVVQEVFVNVYRRLEQFEGRCSAKTWVFGILVRVVNNHRRTRRRKGAGHATSAVVGDPELVVDASADPLELASRSQAGRIVHQLLEKLDEDKAAVFVLAEVEGLTVPEIAEIMRANVNTVYSRLRAARKDFERARKQHALGREVRTG